MRNRFMMACAIMATALAALVTAQIPSSAALSASIKHGGAITVVMVGSSYPSLDPALDINVGTDSNYMSALYEGLFYQTLSGGIGYNLATAAKYSDGNRKLTITIRKGVQFSDGTPLNAAAVAFNLNRDDTNDCNCFSFFAQVSTITAVKNTVVLQMKEPDAALLENFIANGPNWPASPTAIQKEGSAFGQNPVGAGPFKVVSFQASTQIVMVRNPLYYQKGHPYLDQVTFLDSTVDQSAYSALEAGTAQLVDGVSTPSVIQQAKTAEKVYQVGSPTVIAVELNSYKPPFNSLVAREAVAYAINPTQVLQIASPNHGRVVEGIQGPGGYGYEAKIPGYRHFDLAKAQQLVHQLGGLSLNIQTSTTTAALLLSEAVQSQLQDAGMTVSISQEPTSVGDVNSEDGNWQANLGTIGTTGGINPNDGPDSMVTRLSSSGTYTCCHDASLDGLINQAVQTAGAVAELKILDKIYAYAAAKQYVVPLFTEPNDILYSPSLMGLTVPPANVNIAAAIDWADLWLR